MDEWKEFAEVARAARDRLGWKRGELQRRTGIKPSTLSHILLPDAGERELELLDDALFGGKPAQEARSS